MPSQDLPRVDAASFVELLSPAIRQAASIARALEGRVGNTPKNSESTAAKQALTVADTATQETLVVPLFERFPWVALEAEEDTETARLFPQEGPERVVIDPIDGTLHSYLRAEGPYAVIVGLARAGRYEAALVALPREGLFFDAVRGGGAHLARAGASRRPARIQENGPRVLVSNGMPEPVVDAVRAAGWDPVPACGGAVAVAPLIPGVRGGIRWGTGRSGISVRGRVGLLIAREAGLIVQNEVGGEFPDDLASFAPGLVVAKNAEDAQVLGEALARREDG